MTIHYETSDAIAIITIDRLEVANAIDRPAAERYLAFLASAEAQAAYAKYGFVNASAQDLALKPIP